MPNRVLNRVSASLLLVVFLATGGLRALDAAVYHRDAASPGTGVVRLIGTDAPAAHADRCVLGAELRGSSAVATGPDAPAIHAPVCHSAPATFSRAPRSIPLHLAPARAPPVFPA